VSLPSRDIACDSSVEEATKEEATHMTPPKLAIAIDLDDLSALMDEYVDSQGLDIKGALTLSMFLLWLRKRQETSDETKQN
jgi:hypothetical protein